MSVSQLWRAIREDPYAEIVAAGVLLLNLVWCSIWALRIVLEVRHCGDSECWSGLTFFVVWLGGELALAVPLILSAALAAKGFIRKRGIWNSLAAALGLAQGIVIVSLVIYGMRG